ncbi:MAG: 5-formyltetrahydrofolate cyclo-ligase [Phycisphaerales bacterium]
MSDPLVILKRTARAEGRSAVASMSAEAREAASAAICERLAAWWEGSGVPARAMVYLSKPGPDGLEEPDLGGLIERWRRLGVRLAAPRMDWDSGRMSGVELSFDEAGAVRTEVRRFGVPEPVVVFGAGTEAGESGGLGPEAFDVILVPGVAFDERGARVGRGAGFYDRWLGGLGSARGRVVGVAFDVQVLREVPRGPHDALMDVIVTERRWSTG